MKWLITDDEWAYASLRQIQYHFFWSASRINEFGEFWSFSRKCHCNKIAQTISMKNISAFFSSLFIWKIQRENAIWLLVQISRQNDISHEICFVMTQHILYIGSSDSKLNFLFASRKYYIGFSINMESLC